MRGTVKSGGKMRLKKSVMKTLRSRVGVAGLLLVAGWLAGGCAVMRPPTQQQFETREAELKQEGIEPGRSCDNSWWGFGLADLLYAVTR